MAVQTSVLILTLDLLIDAMLSLFIDLKHWNCADGLLRVSLGQVSLTHCFKTYSALGSLLFLDVYRSDSLAGFVSFTMLEQSDLTLRILL